MDEIERLFLIRIRDPQTRAIVRGRLADFGGTAVTDNAWELPRTPTDDPDGDAQVWDDMLRWLEDNIDQRTDVIYMWVCSDGAMIRTSIGAAE